MTSLKASIGPRAVCTPHGLIRRANSRYFVAVPPLAAHCRRSLSTSSKHTVCSYRDNGPRSRSGSNSSRNPRRRRGGDPLSQSFDEVQIVVRKYAVPTIGLVALAAIAGPIIGVAALTAFEFAIALGAAAAVFSLAWLMFPILLGIMGIPLLFGGGVAVTVLAGAAGVLVLPALVRLAVIAAAVGMGMSLARSFWLKEEYVYDDRNEDDGVIDVDAASFDELEREMEAEARKRAKELEEFDDLLRQRERFQRGSGGSRY